MKTEKICTRCHILKPISQYSVNSTYADNHSNWCKPCHVEYSSEWSSRHKERRLLASREWNKNNLEKRRAARRKWQRKFNTSMSPIDKLHTNMRTKLCRQLKAKKNGKATVQLLGYTMADLKKHLEGKFRDGMTWDNYGKWHIDHIRPKASFAIQSPQDESFKECWSLKNLQPLWASENCQKQARWTAN